LTSTSFISFLFVSVAVAVRLTRRLAPFGPALLAGEPFAFPVGVSGDSAVTP
jgi:hypothetical protein